MKYSRLEKVTDVNQINKDETNNLNNIKEEERKTKERKRTREYQVVGENKRHRQMVGPGYDAQEAGPSHRNA